MDPLVLAVGLQALGFAGLVVWAARLEREVNDLRRAARPLAGQTKHNGLESTSGGPRPADQERPLHAEQRPYGSQMAVREQAERILRRRAKRKGAGMEGGG